MYICYIIYNIYIYMYNENKMKNYENKTKEIEKLTSNEYLRKSVGERFDEQLDLFTFPSDISNYVKIFVQMLLI